MCVFSSEIYIINSEYADYYIVYQLGFCYSTVDGRVQKVFDVTQPGDTIKTYSLKFSRLCTDADGTWQKKESAILEETTLDDLPAYILMEISYPQSTSCSNPNRALPSYYYTTFGCTESDGLHFKISVDGSKVHFINYNDVNCIIENKEDFTQTFTYNTCVASDGENSRATYSAPQFYTIVNSQEKGVHFNIPNLTNKKGNKTKIGFKNIQLTDTNDMYYEVMIEKIVYYYSDTFDTTYNRCVMVKGGKVYTIKSSNCAKVDTTLMTETASPRVELTSSFKEFFFKKITFGTANCGGDNAFYLEKYFIEAENCFITPVGSQKFSTKMTEVTMYYYRDNMCKNSTDTIKEAFKFDSCETFNNEYFTLQLEKVSSNVTTTDSAICGLIASLVISVLMLF
ncbi:hypothetical protein EIN_109470 [Entamoeba invadens IP1]|uniref:Uncharacterized protein n=1 Tax=Entamoeba invadens IP1 TaxID=370355 RepID=L7FPL4_ENTIV|nr:hypothetical protein EIN_109470 [Entamoeba invadens IP1]ELP94780.1 hypothetical protein EIN_109470 [Entamoeba invadens IP1]|eukprot:XP_004261551.1 hypothetical protein EIN_109470 [Entamoeba invadens IP1]